jgi:hypothetical protein
MARIHNIPAPSQYGKIWRYAVISFCIIAAAALAYWVATSMAAHPTTSTRTQDAVDGVAASHIRPTVN